LTRGTGAHILRRVNRKARQAERSRAPGFGPRAPLRVGDARGVVYGTLSPELREQVAGWIEAGEVPGAEPIKGRRVVRHGELLVKFVRRSRSAVPLRRSRVLRAAAAHERLAWVPVPAPLFALDLPRGAHYEGLIAMRFVDGRPLHELDGSGEAIDALGELIARLHDRGVHHGDLHAQNLLWDGRTWWLLDLDGVRSPLHLVLERRLEMRQWGKLLLTPTLAQGTIRRAFDRYASLRPALGDREAAWKRVQAYAAEMFYRRALRSDLPSPAQRGPGLPDRVDSGASR